MLKSLLLSLAILFSVSTFAQNWAPDGTTWHFEEKNWENCPGLDDFTWLGYVKYIPLGDTIINGQTARVIQGSSFQSQGMQGNPWIEIMYEDNGKVYHLKDGVFYILYDFSLQVGETWKRELPNDTTEFLVQEIQTLNVNGQNLKKMWVQTLSGNYFFDAPIVEQIGCLTGFFPRLPVPIAIESNGTSSKTGSTGAYPYKLRCYQSNILGFYETGLSQSCEEVYRIKNANQSAWFWQKPFVYPNPFVESISFSNMENNCTEPAAVFVQVFDLDGRLQFNQIVSWEDLNNPIDLSFLKPGIYGVRWGVEDDFHSQLMIRVR